MRFEPRWLDLKVSMLNPAISRFLVPGMLYFLQKYHWVSFIIGAEKKYILSPIKCLINDLNVNSSLGELDLMDSRNFTHRTILEIYYLVTVAMQKLPRTKNR